MNNSLIVLLKSTPEAKEWQGIPIRYAKLMLRMHMLPIINSKNPDGGTNLVIYFHRIGNTAHNIPDEFYTTDDQSFKDNVIINIIYDVLEESGIDMDMDINDPFNFMGDNLIEEIPLLYTQIAFLILENIHLKAELEMVNEVDMDKLDRFTKAIDVFSDKFGDNFDPDEILRCAEIIKDAGEPHKFSEEEIKDIFSESNQDDTGLEEFIKNAEGNSDKTVGDVMNSVIFNDELAESYTNEMQPERKAIKKSVSSFISVMNEKSLQDQLDNALERYQETVIENEQLIEKVRSLEADIERYKKICNDLDNIADKAIYCANDVINCMDENSHSNDETSKESKSTEHGNPYSHLFGTDVPPYKNPEYLKIYNKVFGTNNPYNPFGLDNPFSHLFDANNPKKWNIPWYDNVDSDYPDSFDPDDYYEFRIHYDDSKKPISKNGVLVDVDYSLKPALKANKVFYNCLGYLFHLDDEDGYCKLMIPKPFLDNDNINITRIIINN